MLKQQKLVSQAEVLLEQRVVVKPGDAGDGCTSGGQVVWAPVQPYQSGKWTAGAGGTQNHPNVESRAVERQVHSRRPVLVGWLPG